MLGDATTHQELGSLVREVVAVVVEQIVPRVRMTSTSASIKLQGFSVGDGCYC